MLFQPLSGGDVDIRQLPWEEELKCFWPGVEFRKGQVGHLANQDGKEYQFYKLTLPQTLNSLQL